MEFHISRAVREAAQVDDVLFSYSGNVIFATAWERGTVPFFSPTILRTVPDRKIGTVPGGFEAACKNRSPL